MAVPTRSEDKQKKYVVSQVKHHNRLLANEKQLHFSLPRSFSLRENLIKKLFCTGGGEGEENPGTLQEFLCLLRDVSPTMNNKEEEESLKSARKGTSSPVLWQVCESAGTDTQTLPPDSEVPEVSTKQSPL